MTQEPERLSELAEVRHMNFRTKICILLIVLGLANFLIYAVVYEFIGGEAIHGAVRAEQVAFGQKELRYYLIDGDTETRVSRGLWGYSAVHSISILITMGTVLLAMLTLAKDRIVSSMRSSIVRGRTLITILATVVTLISLVLTARFTFLLLRKLSEAKQALVSAGVLATS